MTFVIMTLSIMVSNENVIPSVDFLIAIFSVVMFGVAALLK
jgi:hypothetical protein